MTNTQIVCVRARQGIIPDYVSCFMHKSMYRVTQKCLHASTLSLCPLTWEKKKKENSKLAANLGGSSDGVSVGV